MERFPSAVRDASQVEDAVNVFRRALAAAPGIRSVTVIAIGHATNLLDLLRSPADSISGLPGVELVQRKVKQLVWMGGSYWVKDRVEWNWAACGGWVREQRSNGARASADLLSFWRWSALLHALRAVRASVRRQLRCVG